MAHGYLGEGFGTHGEIDPGRGDHREWRDRDWQDERSDWRNRDRAAMFGDRGEWRDRDRPGDERWMNRARRDERREQDYGAADTDGSRNERGRFGEYAGIAQGRRNISANPDDHYRSWRDRHMGEIDRDYEDYCREREQQFHRDFDDWRRNHRPAAGERDAVAGESELELTHERALAGQGNTPSPLSEATLGTNNSENALPGRGRPRR